MAPASDTQELSREEVTEAMAYVESLRPAYLNP
jgi:hypothetical protein